MQYGAYPFFVSREEDVAWVEAAEADTSLCRLWPSLGKAAEEKGLSTNFRPTFSSKSSHLIQQPNIPQKVKGMGGKGSLSLLSLGHPVIITLWCIFHHATRPISSFLPSWTSLGLAKVTSSGFVSWSNAII